MSVQTKGRVVHCSELLYAAKHQLLCPKQCYTIRARNKTSTHWENLKLSIYWIIRTTENIFMPIFCHTLRAIRSMVRVCEKKALEPKYLCSLIGSCRIMIMMSLPKPQLLKFRALGVFRSGNKSMHLTGHSGSHAECSGPPLTTVTALRQHQITTTLP